MQMMNIDMNKKGNIFVFHISIAALQQIERCTRYWPLREDATVLCGNSVFHVVC